MSELGLEVYYNGDNAVADFRVDCFRRSGSTWKKVGKYTPDFLIVRRSGDAIEKILIAETKGVGYSRDQSFVERREFMESVFVPANNKGSMRFSVGEAYATTASLPGE